MCSSQTAFASVLAGHRNRARIPRLLTAQSIAYRVNSRTEVNLLGPLHCVTPGAIPTIFTPVLEVSVMSQNVSSTQTLAPLDTSTRLAYVNTYLAEERTQIAWVQVGLSLISFGFSIAKFFQVWQEQHNDHPSLLGARTI